MKILIVFIAVLAFLACNSNNEPEKIPFNAAQWQVIEGQDFPYRDAMLDNLIESRILKSMNRAEVLTTLGEPTRTDGEYLFYRVKQERFGLFPLHTKTLVIKLFSDGTVEWVKVHK